MPESTASQTAHMLIEQARSASKNAYSPYSGARVGAAVSCNDGQVFCGCNVENASYGLTQCAERSALTAAIAAGIKPRQMTEIAIYASGFRRLSPCGACRQVMIELLAEDALVHCANPSGEIETWRVRDLFPEPFDIE